MATKKDFQAAVELLANAIESVQSHEGYGTAGIFQSASVDLLCEIFRRQNPRFDADRFRVAVSKALGER